MSQPEIPGFTREHRLLDFYDTSIGQRTAGDLGRRSRSADDNYDFEIDFVLLLTNGQQRLSDGVCVVTCDHDCGHSW
jgi:hypothetical protein